MPKHRTPPKRQRTAAKAQARQEREPSSSGGSDSEREEECEESLPGMPPTSLTPELARLGVRTPGERGGPCDGMGSDAGSEEDEDGADAGPPPDQDAPGPSTRRATRAARQPKQQVDVGALLPDDLDEEQLKQAWRALPEKHRSGKGGLLQRYRAQFGWWRFQLRQRFSLMFYGLGSKRRLLETFAEEALTDGGVVAFYGYNPGVDAKRILGGVAAALLPRSFKGASRLELLATIEAEPPERQVYVLVHNIDGPGLRSAEEQLWLARLAQCPCVRLLASVDHANACLLWDRRACVEFRWLWHQVHTYAPYEAETAETAPILTGAFQTSAKRCAATVLHSLVSSARAVFLQLAARQLDDPGSQGASFPLLYRLCRERFILSSEAALRAHLAEFRDHELVRTRLAADGGEVMYIPWEEGPLRKMVAELEAAAAAEAGG